MRRAFFPILTLSLTTGLSVLAGAQTLPAPDVKPAQHFQFTPQPGTAWMLEGTADGGTWLDVAGPFFANGRATDHLRPAGKELGFRLRYIDPASVGLAPVTVPAGRTLLMEHQGKAREIIFIDATRGILRLDDAHARTFTTAWTKTAPDAAEAILSGADGSFTLLRLEFLAAGLGRWGMEDIPSAESAAMIKETIDAGGFSLNDGRVLHGTDHAALPSDLTHRRMALTEAGEISILEFTGPDSITLRRGTAPVQQGTYSYDPEDVRTGQLTLNLEGKPQVDFRMEMLTPATGTISQQGGGNGRTPLHSGTFNLPNSPTPPVNTRASRPSRVVTQPPRTDTSRWR